MKYFIPLLFLLLITACSKDSLNLNSDLNGTWELVSSDGGWGGHHDFPAGNGNTFTFNGSSYTQIIKGFDTTYNYSGTFKIYNGKPCEVSKEQTVIKFNDDAMASSFSKSGSKFTISSSECIADGGIQTYQKVQ